MAKDETETETRTESLLNQPLTFGSLFAGIGDVLGDLARMGFDAEWGVLRACAFGAPHMRARMFIVADANGCFVRASRPAKDKERAAGLHFRGSPSPGRMGDWWAVQPEPRSVVYGVPGLVDRLRPYGNAVVPQVAEWIGRRIVEAVNETQKGSEVV